MVDSAGTSGRASGGLSGGTPEERQGALAEGHWISVLTSRPAVKPSGRQRGSEGRGRKKSVLDLIFHTPASYKRLSYTTLAANNQPGKGSQKRRNTLSLTG